MLDWQVSPNANRRGPRPPSPWVRAQASSNHKASGAVTSRRGAGRGGWAPAEARHFLETGPGPTILDLSPYSTLAGRLRGPAHMSED